MVPAFYLREIPAPSIRVNLNNVRTFQINGDSKVGDKSVKQHQKKSGNKLVLIDKDILDR